MVIDLDVRAPEASRAPAVRPTGVILVLLTIALLALGGSAGPPPGLRPVLTLGSSSRVFALTPAALFTADPDPATGHATVRRHALRPGAAEWLVPLPHRVDGLQPAPDGVLVAAAGDGTGVSVLDAATGAVRWRAGGPSMFTGLAGDVLLLFPDGMMRRVEPRDGRVRWSRPLPPDSSLDVGDPIVVLGPGGDLRVIDAGDGTERARGTVGSDPVTRVGDRLYLTRADALIALRLPDLRELWRNGSAPRGLPTGCGRYLCVGDDSGLTVLDPADGTARWSDPRRNSGYDTRAAGTPGSDRLVTSDRGDPPRLHLVDPDDGRLLADLGLSTLVESAVLRQDTARAGRVWVQRAGADDTIRTAGHLDVILPPLCTAAGDHLACPLTTGGLGVWRLPS